MFKGTGNLLSKQIEEASESWRADHEEAMACRDLEDLIRTGLRLFHLIRLTDEGWTKEVQAGTETFEEDVVRVIRHAYTLWLKPCDQVLAAIQKREKDFKIEGAAEFREAVRLARNVTRIKLDDLFKSMRQVDKGEAEVLTAEVWRESIGEDHTSGQETNPKPAKHRSRKKSA